LPRTPDVRSAISDTENASSTARPPSSAITLCYSARIARGDLGARPGERVRELASLMVGEGRYNVWVRDTGNGGASRYQIVAINGS
jgi:hypothetical protein